VGPVAENDRLEGFIDGRSALTVSVK